MWKMIILRNGRSCRAADELLSLWRNNQRHQHKPKYAAQQVQRKE